MFTSVHPVMLWMTDCTDLLLLTRGVTVCDSIISSLYPGQASLTLPIIDMKVF